MKNNLLIYPLMSILLLTGCKAKKESFNVIFEGKTSEKKWAVSELNREIPA